MGIKVAYAESLAPIKYAGAIVAPCLKPASDQQAGFQPTKSAAFRINACVDTLDRHLAKRGGEKQRIFHSRKRELIALNLLPQIHEHIIPDGKFFRPGLLFMSVKKKDAVPRSAAACSKQISNTGNTVIYKYCHI